MRKGIVVSVPITIRISVLILMAVSGLFTVPSVSAQDVKVAYPPGIYGGYRRDLADFALRALTLVDDIGKVEISKAYCTSAERADALARLQALGARMSQLRTDYNNFKSNTKRAAQTNSIMAAFNAAGDNPNADNFWTNADNEILVHPQRDLDAKLNELKKSNVIDCTPKVKQIVDTNTGPPFPPKTQGPDPLAGLTRPPVLPKPPFPLIPGPFCSEAERNAWIAKNIQPLMDANHDATNALSKYGNAIWDRMGSKTFAGNPEAMAKLHAELMWQNKAHLEMDAWYFELQRYRDRLVVVDCTNKTATGNPFPQETLTVPIPRTRSVPPVRVDSLTVPATRTRPVLPTGIDSTKVPFEKIKEKEKDKVGMVTPWSWRIGVDGEYNYYPEFAHTAGDQKNILTSTEKQTASGIGLSAGLGYHDWLLDFSGHINTLKYEQAYKPNLMLPSRSVGSLRGRFYDMCGGHRFHYLGTSIDGWVGVTYAIDELTLDELYDGGGLFRTRRILNTWKTNFGVNVDVPISGGFGAQFGSTYTTGGKSNDADVNLRVRLGLVYRRGFSGNY